MMFQRNQPPMERMRAMALVMVLECVSMNLLIRLVSSYPLQRKGARKEGRKEGRRGIHTAS